VETIYTGSTVRQIELMRRDDVLFHHQEKKVTTGDIFTYPSPTAQVMYGD
jgi:hypothetical protein